MIEFLTLAQQKLSLLAISFNRLQDILKSSFAKNHLKISFFLVIIVLFQLVTSVLRDLFDFSVPSFLYVFLMWVFVKCIFGYGGIKLVATGVIFLLLSVFFMMFGAVGYADQSANLAFLFLVFGFLQLFVYTILSPNRKEV